MAGLAAMGQIEAGRERGLEHGLAGGDRDGPAVRLDADDDDWKQACGRLS